MAIGKDFNRQVQCKIDQWNREAMISFCLCAKKTGVIFTNVVYPTGLKMAKAEVGGYSVEVPLRVAKKLRNDGYTIHN